MRKTAALLSFILLVTFVDAQDSQQKKPALLVSSFSLSMGFAGVMTGNTIEDYNSLKNSVADPGLFIDPAGYNNNNFAAFEGNASPKINLGITPYCKKLGRYRYEREIRIGIGTNFGNRRTFDYYKHTTFPADTFQSVSGNPNIYADSSIWEGHYYAEQFVDLNFSLSFLFKTDTKKRVHLYTGAGIEYGIAIRSSVNILDYTDSSLIYYDENNALVGNDEYYGYYGHYWSGVHSSSSTTINMSGTTHFLRAYIPIGINFRISNNNSFFKHLNIYSEFSPGIEFQIISNDKTYVNPYFGFALVGLSYKW